MKTLFFFGFITIVIAAGITLFLLLTQSIRLDEAQSIWASTKPVGAILDYISHDVHVPLYTLLLHFWMQIFGSSIIAARSLSFLFFLLTLPVLYQVAKEAGDKKIALLTIILFSLSPFITWYASETRMYSLFTLITITNTLFFLRFVRSQGNHHKFWYVVTAIVGVYTHYFFLIIIATQAVFLFIEYIWMAIQHDEENKILFKKLFLYFIGMLFPIALAFAPWIIYVLSQGSASNTQPQIAPPSTFNILQVFANFLFGFQTQGIQSLLISLWPLSVIVLFFIFTQKRHIAVENLSYFVLATFFPIFLVFVISYFRPVFLSRYLIFVTPTLFFLLAWVLANYSKKTASLATATLIVIMLALLGYQSMSNDIAVKEDYSHTAQYLEKNTTPQDIIAASAPFTIYPLEYSYTGKARIDTIPQWNVYATGAIPPFSSQNLAKQIKNYATTYKRVFLVLSYDQGYEDTIQKYMDAHYKLNSKKQFSPGLQVREYQLRYDKFGKPL